MTRSSDDCDDDDALANISSPVDVLTALRQKYGLKEATIITPAAASPASGKRRIFNRHRLFSIRHHL